jgi:glutathione S-transferase
MSLELISFKLCPFVQRSVITLLEKGHDFQITYINLDAPPPWFKDVSPLAKVPVLKVGGEVLFESAIINEYIDEITPPSLHPIDSLTKAKNRAWIEFGSELLMIQFRWIMSQDQCSYETNLKELQEKLQRLETATSGGSFFNGETFSLVDAAFAPLFMRLELLKKWTNVDFYGTLPKIQHWSTAVLTKESVKNSVVNDFTDLFELRLKNAHSYIFIT